MSLEWKKINSENHISVRFGHTAVLYQKRLIVFGGLAKLTMNTGPYFLQDIEIFNVEDKVWSTSIVSRSTLKLRRNHVAILVGMYLIYFYRFNIKLISNFYCVGSQMFIHGGVGDDEEYFGDCGVFLIVSQKWFSCPVSEKTPPPILSNHTCCLVFPHEIRNNSKMSIYKLPDLKVNRRPEKVSNYYDYQKRISIPGIYVYGGQKNSNGDLNKDIFILRIGRKPLEWYKPQISGNAPRARYSHTMSFYEDGNFLIIHGGRNDSTDVSYALCDTFLLDLKLMEWIEVHVFSDTFSQVFNRCSHAAILNCNFQYLI